MKKLLFAVLLSFVLPLAARAQDTIPNYKGFPVYPPETIKKYADKESAHIKVLLSSYDFVKDAKVYVENASKNLGWVLKEQSLESPLVQTYVKEGEITKLVKVRYNREMSLEGAKEVEMYYDAPQGSVEYTFLEQDTSAVYQIKKIVTKNREDAVDAYIALLKKESFEDVAAKYSINDKVEHKVVVDPLSAGTMEREIMRLLPGQISDIFQGKDFKYNLVKLIDVSKNNKSIRHAGQNTEDRRPSSVDLTYSSKDSSLAEVMVDRIGK